jgi:hypothetical protein
VDGPERQCRQNNEAFAPMVFFAERGIANDAGTSSVAFLKS